MVQLKEEYPHHQIKQMNNAITEAEVKAYQELQTRDLSDEELDGVAGGITINHNSPGRRKYRPGLQDDVVLGRHKWVEIPETPVRMVPVPKEFGTEELPNPKE